MASARRRGRIINGIIAWAENPAKARVEKIWLLYTPVWGVIVGAVMLTGWAERWGDLELLLLGGLLALGAVLIPVLAQGPAERARPLAEQTAVKLGVSVVGFAFGMNYLLTPYFFDVLHMHYGFATNINIENNPLFLYFITVPYFATYAALITIGYRRARRVPTRWSRYLAIGWVPLAVAALETLLNANPFMKRLFCFDDLGLMLTFGTASYGTALACAMPVWNLIDERPSRRIRLGRVTAGIIASLAVMVLLFQLSRRWIAPHLTEVQPGAVGLRDFEGSCLRRPVGPETDGM